MTFQNQRKVLIFSITMMFINTFIALNLLFNNSLLGKVKEINVGRWIETDLLLISWNFHFDNASLVMISLVSFISSLVHLYSYEYMKNDPHIIRFFSYLSFFTFFMLLLVSSSNLVQLFVGWEGVGLCSYLLINFWFTRVQANKAALKALIMNRIGDFFFILALVFIYKNFKSFDFGVILDPNIIEYLLAATTCHCMWDTPIAIITFLLFFAAVGKSAQLGLHTWLPDAMEGPTPVSALIHAATMVTAGVFLIIRCSTLFNYAPSTCLVMSVFGVLTAVIAGFIGLVQYDIKKVIAYSTCSQLGYMVFACGLNQYSISFFHLINHAFFKALLFLGAGAIIHALNDEQDIRKMGGLQKILPFLYQIFLIGSLALAGIPFLTGFYSKDLLLEVAYGNSTNMSQYLFWLGTFGAFLTAYYSTRLIYYVFWADVNGYKSVYKMIHEPGLPITVVLMLLAIGSIFFGYYAHDLFVGTASTFFSTSFTNGLQNNNYDVFYDIPLFYKFLPLFVTILAIIASIFLAGPFNLFLTKLQLNKKTRFIYVFFNKKWFFDTLYNIVAYININQGFKISYEFFDKGFLELFGPMGATNIIYKCGKIMSSFHNGFINNLMQIFFIGFFIFLNLVFLSL